MDRPFCQYFKKPLLKISSRCSFKQRAEYIQGTFKPLTVIIGVERTDEREFIETLCKLSGDSHSRSTPIKSRRNYAAAGTSYNGECNQ